MSWILGNKSKEIFDTLHNDLGLIIQWGLRYSPIDFSLEEGHRAPEKQFEYFRRGREEINGKWSVINEKLVITNCDGYDMLSNHNYLPSRAFDFRAYIPGKPKLSYDIAHLTAIATTFIVCSEFLFEQGKIKHKIRWGANWDMDGELLFDQQFDDSPHIELWQ